MILEQDMEFTIEPKENTNTEERTYELKDEGWYEVSIAKIEEKSTPNGYRYLNFSFQIREDIEQKYKKHYCFKKLFRNRETNEYSIKCISWIAGACQVEGNVKLSNLLDTLIGRCLKIRIKHQNYQGKVYEDVDNFEKSHFTDYKEQARIEEELKQMTSHVEVDELPF